MDEDYIRPIAYIAVHGIEKLRDKKSRFVPCGFGVVLFSDAGRQRLRGVALVKDTQDCFAYAMTRAINEIGRNAAEKEGGSVDLESVDFRTENDRFMKKKFGNVLDAKLKRGTGKSGKPYHSYDAWNEASALKALSELTIHTISDGTDGEFLFHAEELAREAAQRMNSVGFGLLQEEDLSDGFIWDFEEFIAEFWEP